MNLISSVMLSAQFSPHFCKLDHSSEVFLTLKSRTSRPSYTFDKKTWSVKWQWVLSYTPATSELGHREETLPEYPWKSNTKDWPAVIAAFSCCVYVLKNHQFRLIIGIQEHLTKSITPKIFLFLFCIVKAHRQQKQLVTKHRAFLFPLFLWKYVLYFLRNFAILNNSVKITPNSVTTILLQMLFFQKSQKSYIHHN